MIELNDKQISKFRKDLTHKHLVNNSIDHAFNGLELTLPQIKQLAEQHNASVLQWVEFDSDDESTWPEKDDYVLTYFHVNGVINPVCMQMFDTTNGCFVAVGGNDFDMAVTHWAYLPTVKEK